MGICFGLGKLVFGQPAFISGFLMCQNRMSGKQWVYEERDKQRVSLLMMVLLYNYRANNMDLNQIQSVYWNSAVIESHNQSGMEM